MKCRLADMHCKEVIDISSGKRFGYVYDVMFDSCTGQICALIVPGECAFLGIFGREDDYVIPWERVKRVGEDLILVDLCGELRRDKRPPRAVFR